MGMNTSDGDWLRQYLDGGHHEAAERLVERYLRLVYSAAERCLDGDSASAADVSQHVFLDLFRKAAELRQRESVAGWLHTAACHLARNHRRAEIRRKTHETLAPTMSDFPATEESEIQWASLRPLLDDTLLELPERDREAILQRYFQDESHAAIGTRIGISEDAARMRVGRALDRIREALQRRGIRSTATALAMAMEAAAGSEIPWGLKAQVLGLIPQRLVVPPRPGFGFLGSSRTVRLVSALVATALLVWLAATVVERRSTVATVATTDRLTEIVAEVPPPDSGISGPSATSNPARPNHAPADASLYESDGLRLQIISALTSQPISGGKATAEWLDRHSKPHSELVELTASLGGIFKRPMESAINTSQEYFRINVRAPGFATRNVQWFPRLGSGIPTEYVLRLSPAATIGGRVVEPEGKPVAGATVNLLGGISGFDMSAREFPETSIVAETDAQGVWTNATQESELLPVYAAEARHPDFGTFYAGSLAGVIDQLLARQHVIQFPARGMLRGHVTDESGVGIPDAIVQLGDGVGNDGQRTTSSKTGEFTLRNLPLIDSLISASATGFSPSALPVKVTTDRATAPFRLVLSKGGVLRVRVVSSGTFPHSLLGYKFGPTDICLGIVRRRFQGPTHILPACSSSSAIRRAIARSADLVLRKINCPFWRNAAQ